TIGRLRLSAMTGDPRARQLPEEIVNVMRQPAARRSPQQHKQLLEYRLAQDVVMRESKVQRDNVALRVLSLARTTTLVTEELPQGRSTKIFMRGDFRTPGANVAAATPAVL